MSMVFWSLTLCHHFFLCEILMLSWVVCSTCINCQSLLISRCLHFAWNIFYDWRFVFVANQHIDVNMCLATFHFHVFLITWELINLMTFYADYFLIKWPFFSFKTSPVLYVGVHWRMLWMSNRIFSFLLLIYHCTERTGAAVFACTAETVIRRFIFT